MTVPSPNLDDRRWDDLVAEAKDYLRDRTPAWTDFSPSDPGMVLVELFAHLTDLLIYRLNRVPEKAYREYLRLIGLTLRPPAAAAATVRFSTDEPVTAPVAIPRATRVSVNRRSGSSEPPIFSTAESVTIAPGEKAVEVLVHNCEFVEGELLGRGTGQPGQSVRVRRPPIIAPSGNELDLVVGVEARPGEFPERVAAREHDGRPFVIWDEVESFVDRSPEDRVYTVDRLRGRITFAAAVSDEAAEPPGTVAMAAFPPLDREIRAWYRRGGGAGGNVPAGTITVLKDAIAGVSEVVNPEAATGGRPAEPLEEALIRGPQELHSVERAVTAQDYEGIARRASGAVARARAFTKTAIWAHADPGTVEVLLVPYVDPGELGDGGLTPELLHAHETDTARDQIQDAIDERRPLGIACEVNWASYKTVSVAARVVVRREENLEAVRRRVEERLHATINPLPDHGRRSSGWRFGQALRASHVYDMVLKEPGVRFVDNVSLRVEHAPGADVLALAPDHFQPEAWYAGAGGALFRSLNDAESWELVTEFEAETVRRIESHPERPGIVAAVTTAQGGSRVHYSLDAGETWDVQPLPKPEFKINDIAWSVKDGGPTLLAAADGGLFELALEGDRIFIQVLVTSQQTRGFYAVAAAVDALGARNVAVAAQGAGGVWLSSENGAPQTFREAVGLSGEDIRTLAIQRDGPRAYLWAGAAAAGAQDPGKGAWRWELRGGDAPPEGWVAFGKGWSAGSCWGLAFRSGVAYAATHHGGVLRVDPRSADAAWIPLDVEAGLPLRDPTQFLFEQVDAVAARDGAPFVLAGGDEGVFASKDGKTWAPRSEKVFRDAVALPDTWLFVSGRHEIEVVAEGGAAK
jgi:hypothetical protein